MMLFADAAEGGGNSCLELPFLEIKKATWRTAAADVLLLKFLNSLQWLLFFFLYSWALALTL
jgi:hypothetical protein